MTVALRPVANDSATCAKSWTSDTPVLGAIPGVENAFVATGHGANGLLLGPISARLVTELVLGREPTLDLAPFAPSRFDTTVV